MSGFAATKRFRAEHKRLRGFADAVEFAFRATERDFKNKVAAGKLDPAAPIKLSVDSETAISPHTWAFLRSIGVIYPRYSREIIFVRAVSNFEVLLVDLIRDAFHARPDLLADPKRFIQISHGEILSGGGISNIRNRIIASELRQLHSKGLREIAKFYDKKIGIRFSELGIDLSQFWEMIDRRHLLVHRLGRADELYRKSYNYDRKANLSISKDYLISAMDIFFSIAETVENRLAKHLSEERTSSRDIPTAELEIAFLAEGADAITSTQYTFIVNHTEKGEQGASLGDILRVRKATDSGGEVLFLEGDGETIQAYLRHLKKSQRRGNIHVVIRQSPPKKPRLGASRPSKLPREVLLQIAEALPLEPWPKGVHKDLAEAFGIGRKECSRALTTILGDPELMALASAPKKVEGT